MKNSLLLYLLASITALTPQAMRAQSPPAASLSLVRPGESAASFLDLFASKATSADSNASPPEPAPSAAYDHYAVAPAATWYQIPFSRIGLGADISPLGVGIKSAIVLGHDFDARLMGNFLSIDTGNFKVDGFEVNANIHFDSAAAALDFYPLGSMVRISPGLLFLNGNKVTVASELNPGTSFTLNGQTFYSANLNAVTGAVPLSGAGVLGLHSHAMAPTITAGFGKFIPRSNRHWSFPSEFGVAFTGAPTANVNVSGWACADARQTKCSDVGNPANPVAILFNNSLNAQLTKWRKDLGKVTIYPLFSYSVMYSFNIR